MIDIKTITDLIDKYGIRSAIFIVISFALYTIFKNKYVVELVKKLFDKLISKSIKSESVETSTSGDSKILFKDSDIINHEIFSYIDFWLYSSLPTLKFKTEYRTAIFNRYLTIYFKQYRESLFVFVNDGKYKDLDNATLKSTLHSLFNNIVFEYENKMRIAQIPEVVISKMKSKNNETNNLLLELTNSVCDNHFYDTEKNMLKIFTILNILNATLEYIINIAEEVCNNINGELSGKEYDGFKEPTKEHSYLDINDVKNDFIHIYIDSDGILVVKILDDVILDDQKMNNYFTLIRSVNGDIKRLIIFDASTDWNITDKAKKILGDGDDNKMTIARAVIVKKDSQKNMFLTLLKNDSPLKIFDNIESARKWLLEYK